MGKQTPTQRRQWRFSRAQLRKLRRARLGPRVYRQARKENCGFARTFRDLKRANLEGWSS